MQAVCLVAHPDDCVIFGWPFIEAHPEFNWHINYLTYNHWDSRGKELADYWKKRNILTRFMGYSDDWNYVKDGKLGFDVENATKDLIKIGKNYDLILTHFEDGDYGHIHHKFVNSVAKQIDRPKVYFASTFNYNTKYITNNPVDVTELPLHQTVIEGFQDRHIGLYIVTDEAEKLFKNNK